MTTGTAGTATGVGTPDTQISFAVDHSTIRYNTQDGLDIFHTTGSTISVTDSTFYGNMGQQWKLGPMANVLVRNNLTITNCRRMAENIPGAPAGWKCGAAALVPGERGRHGGATR